MTIFDSSGIEAFVTENNPKYANRIIKMCIRDRRDIELKDLSGMESLAKADELMQQWAYETFDGNNIPMCEFTMLKLPEGYNGFFLHMDHRPVSYTHLDVYKRQGYIYAKKQEFRDVPEEF